MTKRGELILYNYLFIVLVNFIAWTETFERPRTVDVIIPIQNLLT